jgi:hypothetical protein
MTSTEQLKDICERFERHVNQCPVCDVVVDMEGDMKRFNVLSLHISMEVKPWLCKHGKSILLDIFC